MLKFIFGRAATGKTSTVLNLIKQDILNGKKAVLIIPEQFSFESEKAVLELLGDDKMSDVAVLSFSRLCDEVERIVGGISGTVLTDSDKLILMCRAVNISADDLKIWGRYKNSLGFAKAMLETIDEFKINAVSADQLLNASKSGLNKSLSDKLYDTAVIYNNFTLLTGERFIDQSERLTKLYDRLADCRYFENKNVYFDSFKGFTGQQFKIIDRVLSQAENVYISLCKSAEDSVHYDVFENIRKTAERIKKYAKKHNIAVEKDFILDKSHYKSDGLFAVEELLYKGETEKSGQDGCVTVCKCSDIYEEAEYTAKAIRKTVRENPDIRYRDIVIIARDTSPYEEAIISECKKNEVSCFVDKRYPLSSFPPIAAALSAIEAVKGFSTEAILRFYKTGLGGIALNDLSKLENYTYIWNINGSLWQEEWNMNPQGFVAEEMNEKDTAELKKINEIRLNAILPFLEFKKNYKGSTSDRAAAIVKLFEACRSADALKEMTNTYKNQGDAAFADALNQSWDIFMSLLNSMVLCMGEGNVSDREFTDILKSSVSYSSVATTPQMLDEVTFGAADRIRPSRPKVAFILGANQNIFPKNLSPSGLFAANERSQLISSGIEISDCGINDALDEEFLVYTNVCCPTEKLIICYHTSDTDGKEACASAFVDLICQNGVAKETEYTNEHLPETPDAAFTEFCKTLSTDKSTAMSIGRVLSEYPNYSDKIKSAANGYLNKNFSISEAASEKLFGNNIKLSPSKLDTFMRCSFSFLCRYGLKARKLQPAEFDVMQRGTIVHYVLQRLIETYKKGVAELKKEEIYELVDLYINEYLDSINGYRTIETARMKYLTYSISRSVKEVVLQIAAEFAQSDFEPVRCELKIGGDEVPSPRISLENNKGIYLEGTADRVDIWNGYVRIIDYKTGIRKFKLPEVLVGQNMQMLIYLYAITKKGTFEGSKPAGIFYMPSKRDLNGTGMRMDGLSVLDDNVAEAMERDKQGVFVPPLKYTQKGDISHYYKNNFLPEEDFDVIFSHIEKMMHKMGNKILKGDFSVNPIDGIDSPACKYCDFSAVCGIEDRQCQKVEAMNNSEVIEILKEDKTYGV